MKRSLTLFFVLALAACSKAPGGATNSASSSSDLPTANLNMPDSAYIPITTQRQVWVMYDALSGDPPSDMMLWSIDPTLMGADPFQKKDKEAKLLPELATETAQAKDHRYITFTEGRLDPYSFDHKAFGYSTPLLNGPNFSHAKVAGAVMIDVDATNAQAFQWIRVPDEVKAKDIQTRMTGGWIAQVKVFAYVQGATKVQGITQTLQIQITKVQVLDPQGHVLIEQSAGG